MRTRAALYALRGIRTTRNAAEPVTAQQSRAELVRIYICLDDGNVTLVCISSLDSLHELLVVAQTD